MKYLQIPNNTQYKLVFIIIYLFILSVFANRPTEEAMNEILINNTLLFNTVNIGINYDEESLITNDFYVTSQDKYRYWIYEHENIAIITIYGDFCESSTNRSWFFQGAIVYYTHILDLEEILELGSELTFDTKNVLHYIPQIAISAEFEENYTYVDTIVYASPYDYLETEKWYECYTTGDYIHGIESILEQAKNSIE